MTWQDKWLSPALLTFVLSAVFGAIVWGVQLNWSVVELNKSNGEIMAELRRHYNETSILSQQLSTTSIVLAGLEKRISKAEAEADAHAEEAQDWKYRIIQLEQQGRIP